MVCISKIRVTVGVRIKVWVVHLVLGNLSVIYSKRAVVVYRNITTKKVKVAHTRLPSVGFRS